MKSEKTKAYIEHQYGAYTDKPYEPIAFDWKIFAAHAVNLAEEDMKQKAIEAFKFATNGYFIIGGTDYSANRLSEFIEKLNS